MGTITTRHERLLVLAVTAWVPLELAFVAHVVAARGHAGALFTAAAIDFVLLSGGALAWLARPSRGGWSRLALTPSRLARLMLWSLALASLGARLAGVPWPSAMRLVPAIGELTVIALVVRALRRGRVDDAERATPVVGIFVDELSVLAAAWRFIRRRPVETSPDTFRAVAGGEPARIALVIALLSLVELPLVHVIAHVWLGGGHLGVHALIVAVHLYGLVWLAGDARLVAESGHRLDGKQLQLRLGIRWRGAISVDDIAAITALVDPPRRLPGAIDVRPFVRPNLQLELKHPVTLRGLVGIRRTATIVRLYVDEPQRLIAALDDARRIG